MLIWIKVHPVKTVQIWPELKKFSCENCGGIMRQANQLGGLGKSGAPSLFRSSDLHKSPLRASKSTPSLQKDLKIIVLRLLGA